MTTEQAEKRVLRWYGSMPAGDFYADVQAYREAIRAETAAPLEAALREVARYASQCSALNFAMNETYVVGLVECALSSPGGGDA